MADTTPKKAPPKPETLLRRHAKAWLEAKEAENDAKAKREKAAAALLKLDADLLKRKIDGSATTNFEGFKLVVTSKKNLTFDPAEWNKIKNQIPENLQPIDVAITFWAHDAPVDVLGMVRSTVKGVDEVLCPNSDGIEWLRVNQPDIHKLVMSTFTEKPTEYIRVEHKK